MTAALATERECQATIIEAAKLGGWLVHGERPAYNRFGSKVVTPIVGDAGWPDLYLVHPVLGKVIVAELKRKPNKPTPEQLSWLLALELAGTDARLVYVPEQLDDLCAELVTARRRT